MLQWLREAAHFLQDGMRVGCFSAEHEGEGGAEKSCATGAWGHRDEANKADMYGSAWEKHRARSAQGLRAAGDVRVVGVLLLVMR